MSKVLTSKMPQCFQKGNSYLKTDGIDLSLQKKLNLLWGLCPRHFENQSRVPNYDAAELVAHFCVICHVILSFG